MSTKTRTHNSNNKSTNNSNGDSGSKSHKTHKDQATSTPSSEAQQVVVHQHQHGQQNNKGGVSSETCARGNGVPAQPHQMKGSEAAVAVSVPGVLSSPLSREYPADFKVDNTYKATLPDLQNYSPVKGAQTVIQNVGISNFRLPLRYLCRDRTEVTLDTAVTGTVSLRKDQKGINMSRIMTSFYTHSEKLFSFGVMDAVIDDYIRDIGSDDTDARLQMRFSYPLRQGSLRSGLSGYQHYDTAIEVIHVHNASHNSDNSHASQESGNESSGGAGANRHHNRTRIMHVDYVYSSTCPCSLELSEHARITRCQMATPHSQRSRVRVSCVLVNDRVGDSCSSNGCGGDTSTMQSQYVHKNNNTNISNNSINNGSGNSSKKRNRVQSKEEDDNTQKHAHNESYNSINTEESRQNPVDGENNRHTTSSSTTEFNGSGHNHTTTSSSSSSSDSSSSEEDDSSSEEEESSSSDELLCVGRHILKSE